MISTYHQAPKRNGRLTRSAAAIGAGLLALLILAACRSDREDVATHPAPESVPSVLPVTALPSPGSMPSPTGVGPSSEPPTPGPPTVEPAVSPTPTSLAEGWFAGMATPEPSPLCPEPYPWFFPNPAEECANIVLNTWAVMQPFQGGLMVWFQEGGLTHILIDDGSPFKPYTVVTDPGGPDLPDPDPNLTPPAGLYQPILGFGRFWRGLVPGAEWVRDSLGWATAPEVAYSALWQCNTAEGDAARCYFNGPKDEIIVLARGSSQYWAYLQEAVR